MALNQQNLNPIQIKAIDTSPTTKKKSYRITIKIESQKKKKD